jgi:hypothetical protein
MSLARRVAKLEEATACNRLLFGLTERELNEALAEFEAASPARIIHAPNREKSLSRRNTKLR